MRRENPAEKLRLLGLVAQIPALATDPSSDHNGASRRVAATRSAVQAFGLWLRSFCSLLGPAF
jgi:hypothetical protein